jgi:hypothetical protein
LRWRERVSVRVIRLSTWVRRTVAPLLRPGVFFVGLIGAVYAACQLARSQDIPSAAAWGRHEPLNILLVTSGVVPLIFGTLVLYGYSRILKRRQQDAELEPACKAHWNLAIQELRVPPGDVGKVAVYVWAVRGFKGAKYLDRRASFMLHAGVKDGSSGARGNHQNPAESSPYGCPPERRTRGCVHSPSSCLLRRSLFDHARTTLSRKTVDRGLEPAGAPGDRLQAPRRRAVCNF